MRGEREGRGRKKEEGRCGCRQVAPVTAVTRRRHPGEHHLAGKRMMSDYKVEMINDGMQEFYVEFRGPSEKKLQRNGITNEKSFLARITKRRKAKEEDDDDGVKGFEREEKQRKKMMMEN
ncbi:unnamed protein product [Amaranthus hypochondriacus]